MKGNFKAVMAAIKALKDEEIQKHVAQGYFDVLDQRIELEEVRIIYCTSEKVGGNFEAHSDNEVLVLMDMTPNEELLQEGLAREAINRVQKLKKKAQLIPTDPVLIFYDLKSNGSNKEVQEAKSQLQKVLVNYSSMIKGAVKSEFLPFDQKQVESKRQIISEACDLKGIQLNLTICSTEELQLPKLAWLNVTLDGELQPRFSNSNKASIFLQDGINNQYITLDKLRSELDVLFGLYGISYNIYVVDNQKKLSELKVVDKSLNGKLLVLTRSTNALSQEANFEVVPVPYSNFVNQPSGGTIFTENPKGRSLL